MKAISLWQPWASLIAHGLKRYETRHWATAYRGPILIHAAKRWTRAEHDALDRLRSDHPSVANRLSCDVTQHTMPLGAVVAVAYLADCVPMTDSLIDEQSDLEHAVGGWDVGRFAWKLTGVRAVDPPVDGNGAQGIWSTNTEGRGLGADTPRLHAIYAEVARSAPRGW